MAPPRPPSETLSSTFCFFSMFQLSQQAHYDFGLRSVKTVLLLAGELRRQDPSANEESLLIRAI
ncbi:putative dynein heavy chain, partial [Toxoplasma gondii FOU]